MKASLVCHNLQPFLPRFAGIGMPYNRLFCGILAIKMVKLKVINKMKKIFITIVLLTVICSSFAQTITWKKIASLPEACGSGEAVSLNGKIYFVAGRASKLYPYFYEYDPKIKTWKKLADIPNPTTNLALAAVNGKVYAIGGDLFLDANREYNPNSNSWRLLEPMPTARQHIDCGVYEDKIYITGGLTSWESITKNMKFLFPVLIPG